MATSRSSLSVSDVLAEVFRLHHVEVVFGGPEVGASAVFDRLAHIAGIRVITPESVPTAGYAAGGYARFSGKAGVCLSVTAQGAMQLIAPLSDAKQDSVPLVCITGALTRDVDVSQQSDIIECTFPVVKHSYFVTQLQELPQVLNEAFALSLAGRPGPVLVDISRDLEDDGSELEFRKEGRKAHLSVSTQPARGQMNKASELLKAAKRPVILAGGGVVSGNASEVMNQLAEKIEAPVVTTSMGMSSIAAESRLFGGVIGRQGQAHANELFAESDVVLALGTRFDSRVTGPHQLFCPESSVIHVDIDPSEIHKNIRAHIPIQGDVSLALEQWLNDLPKIQRPDWIERLKTLEEGDHGSDILGAQERIVDVIAALSKLAPVDTVLTTGIYSLQMPLVTGFCFKQPRTWVASSALACQGFGLSAALGVKEADSSRLVVALEAPFSLRATLHEAKTFQSLKHKAKVILFNPGESLGEEIEGFGWQFSRLSLKDGNVADSVRLWLKKTGPEVLEVEVLAG